MLKPSKGSTSFPIGAQRGYALCDFWLSGSEGAAGSYSSSAGRRVLTAKIRGLLPEIEVE